MQMCHILDELHLGVMKKVLPLLCVKRLSDVYETLSVRLFYEVFPILEEHLGVILDEVLSFLCQSRLSYVDDLV
jgi:hypothetical protein